MFGDSTASLSWDADHAPTLAPAPAGLSARRVERWLDLPPGAWQRRHLYALRIHGPAYRHFGIEDGDLLIVEPGKVEQPGRIVIVRGAHGTTVRKIASTSIRDRSLPTVLELPLRDREHDGRERVVGVVVGHLRATGTGALRPVSLRGSRRTRRHSVQRSPAARASSEPGQTSPVSAGEIMKLRARWKDWLSAAEPADEPVVERRLRLDRSLATLCDCLERAHSPELRSALVAEASGVLARIRCELGR